MSSKAKKTNIKFSDSKFKKGLMNYAELYLKGKTDKEIFFPRTYVIHQWQTMNTVRYLQTIFIKY